jgi:hypothetical protein
MVAKTSKKGWRNIKLHEELSNLHENQLSAELSNKVDTLFTEDSHGGAKGISKSILKEVKLQNKDGKVSTTSSEAALFSRALSNAGVRKNANKRPAKVPIADLWADAPTKKLKTLLPGTVIRRESFAPAVLPAAATLSVNPSKAEFESMLIAEAEKEMAASSKKSVAQPVSVDATKPSSSAEVASEPAPENKATDRKSRAQKLKEQKHKQMLREHELRTEQDKAARQARAEEQAARQAQRLSTKAKRIVAEAAGQYTLARGAGGRMVAAKEQVPVEIAASLRRVVPLGDPVMERRASLLKRRMIEQVPEINAEYREKLRFAKLDAAKSRKLMDKDARARCVLLA